MSDPIATASDLDTYLGLGGAIDMARATLVLQLTHDLCESIVSPVPVTALAVEIDVAARSYSNPTNEQSGPAMPFAPGQPVPLGGLWLTKANIAELRRLAAQAGTGTTTTAFSIGAYVEDFSDA